MSETTMVHRLRRLQARRPSTRNDALAVLDELLNLSGELRSERDATGAEITRLSLNLDAAQSYGRLPSLMKGRLR